MRRSAESSRAAVRSTERLGRDDPTSWRPDEIHLGHDGSTRDKHEVMANRLNAARAYYRQGNALFLAGRYAEAVVAFDQALALRPYYFEALFDRGSALRRLNRPEEALVCFNKSLALRPHDAKALVNRANALMELGHREAAIGSYTKALAVQPDFIEALVNRGVLLRQVQRPADALASYDTALKLRPESAKILNNIGTALLDLGRLAEAQTSYQQALTVRPDYADAICNLAVIALLMGAFVHGWPGYEYRWGREGAPPAHLTTPFPAWHGEELQGKRIIVFQEQGRGDVIQFARYLPLLVARGATVTFLVHSTSHRLLRTFAPSIRIIGREPRGEVFDYQCALMSLPAAFGTTLDTIPGEVPYLFAEEELIASWGQRLGRHGFKIGICWQGAPAAAIDTGRSPPLRCFQPVAAIPGVRLISLQKIHGLDQLSDLPPGMTVETLGDDFDAGSDAFADTAAIIANLDLIISSDTAVVHLAGAMGRPVWVLLKHVPDWRWMLERGDSPWYPTARLFRQERIGDWNEVFARVAEELTARVAGLLNCR